MPELWTAEDGHQWSAEGLAQEAEGVLAALTALLQGSQPSALPFEVDFRSNDLRPAEFEVLRDTGGVQVRRTPIGVFHLNLEVVEVTAALGALTAPLEGCTERHAKLKVIAVHERALALEVLVQTDGRLGSGGVQQNALWRLQLVRTEDVEQPLLLSWITALSLDEVQLDRRWFEDATAEALGAAGGSSAVLTAGSERWHAGIDNLGEPNEFGHNGIAVGDVDGDGLEDIYVAQGTGLPNLLFVQQADGQFRETGDTSGAAWLDDTKGVLLADYDEDGDLDLVACIGPVIVISDNDGHGHFTPARSLGSNSTASFYSISAADYDLDGDLDLYAVRYVDTSYGDSIPVPFHDARNGPPNKLLRNDGEEGFTDVTEEAGLNVNNDRFSLAASWSDFDLDGDPDLYVANDFGRNNLYRNDGGRFTDVAGELGVEDQAAGMGVSWADVDLDGHFDLLVSNMFSSAGRRIAYQPEFQEGGDPEGLAAIQRHALGNSLFCGGEDGHFEEISDEAGIRMGRWSWGARFADLDGDGLQDLVVPNGFLTGDRDDDL